MLFWLLITGTAGVTGAFLCAFFMAAIIRRSFERGDLKRVYVEQIDQAFRAGLLTAADCMMLSDHEDLAGEIRHTAAAVFPANDNN